MKGNYGRDEGRPNIADGPRFVIEAPCPFSLNLGHSHLIWGKRVSFSLNLGQGL